MFGYIIPAKSELKVREFEIYNAYYCGVCRSIAARYGQLPRFMLTYDAAFIAMMLAASDERPEDIRAFHCMTHPSRKRNLAERTPEIDYAADVMLLLAYLHMEDDRADEHKIRGIAGMAALGSTFRKIKKRLPEKVTFAQNCLREQSALEAAGEKSIDRASEPTAQLMAGLLDWRDADWSPAVHAGYKMIGRSLGRWIYMIDAIDDIEKDRKSGAYNPLKQSGADKERLKMQMTLCLSDAAEALDLLPIKKNRKILENIIYVGLNIKQDEILQRL
ncbi:MAG: DUF5685 family protein [Clostridiales Family XIII bacterium]|jgi:hypothetical protein|nr:DUF5685 family protein [Clostridiales Family XIII bacterium]